MPSDRIANEVDRKSEELFKEFDDHYNGVLKAHPEMNDRHEVFLCWAVQKIAGMHCLLIKQSEDIERLKAIVE